MKGVWDFTFSVRGYSIALFAGTAFGAFRNAYTKAPKRYTSNVYDMDDGCLYQVSDQAWIREGMRNGAICGVFVNTFWPILTVVGVPSIAIYFVARELQKKVINEKG